MGGACSTYGLEDICIDRDLKETRHLEKQEEVGEEY